MASVKSLWLNCRQLLWMLAVLMLEHGVCFVIHLAHHLAYFIRYWQSDWEIWIFVWRCVIWHQFAAVAADPDAFAMREGVLYDWGSGICLTFLLRLPNWTPWEPRVSHSRYKFHMTRQAFHQVWCNLLADKQVRSACVFPVSVSSGKLLIVRRFE
jgi:hypothetical protein